MIHFPLAGNLTKTQRADGSIQRMTYDAANRLVEVKNDANNAVYESYRYGVGNRRLVSESSGMRTYYAGGGQPGVEYVEAVSGGSLTWSKSFIYMGGSLLATISPNGGGGEYVEYHHPDRLGTRLTTNNLNTSFYEQVTLPYGTALDAESTGATNRRFTSYDRSPSTGLDYAVNRTYDSAQGRFTQVDPIAAGASSLSDPQSWNLYAYCGNDPVNHLDPDGLFFKKLFKAIGKFFKKYWKVIVAVAIVVAVAILTFGAGAVMNGIWSAVKAVGNSVASAFKAVGNAISKGLSSIFGSNSSYELLASNFIQDGAALPAGYAMSGNVLTYASGAGLITESVVVVAGSSALLPIAGGLVAGAGIGITFLALVNIYLSAPAASPSVPGSNSATNTNGNPNRPTSNNNTNSNRTPDGRGQGNKWSCFAKAALIDLASNSAVGYVTGAGHANDKSLAGRLAKRDAANNTREGFRAKHNKVTKCIKRF